MTDINAMIERVRNAKWDFRLDSGTVVVAADDRDALLAHIDALKLELKMSHFRSDAWHLQAERLAKNVDRLNAKQREWHGGQITMSRAS